MICKFFGSTGFQSFQPIKIHSIARQHSIVNGWKFGKAGALQCSLKLFSRLICHGPLICGRSVLDFFLKYSGFNGIFGIITGIVSENTKLWEKNLMMKKKFIVFFLKFFCCSTLGIFEVLEEFWLRPRGVIKSILWGIGLWKKVQDLREHFNYGKI